ncbi:putative DNA helicase [Helianthus annuus]|uniref:DNA helicase n=1 Tax=Helianthus annuus TaxID=4232 RepID=A0A9K3E4L0_HELAN|nr:Werner Syndrome-like exonuclease [Helianthus annuus]KAF5766786.1 putative DNA helicase [Helianthus annuus]KAJ0453121.1 putative DNA helicase [Helianthus annuus]KAJ0458251.1 putative DNA helicase [Helianthus annuus]KAJ0475037.1 putative DNA helicase [Helianthus annuus]KAJ0650593.1 putative DNA helicase [Helianthus annuus]
MAISISNHQVPYNTHDYFDVTFSNDTILTLVTHTPSYVDMWISDIERIHRHRLHSLVVGLDIEWRPSFNRNIQNPVATLQLCVGRRCLIFQLLHAPSIPQSLVNFLRNPNYTFTGVGIESDVEKLVDDYNLGVERMEDLRTLAAEAYGEWELKNGGIKSLAERVLGKEVNKPKWVTMSKWDQQWLKPAQVQYACVDAFLSFEIGKVLISGNYN